MAQGLQCWDGSGRLIVDLGDYNLRFVQNFAVTCSGTALTWNFNFPGMDNTGWLIVPPFDATGVVSNYVCIANTNSFTVRYLWTTHGGSDTFTVGIYTYS